MSDLGEHVKNQTNFGLFFFLILVFSGAIIEGDELKVNVMKDVLKGIDDVNRKVAIGIVNKSGMKLEAPSIYFFSGTANGILPRIVDDGKRD